MKTVCEKNRCNACMACVSICPKQCISIQDDIYAMNAVIDESLCINCNSCHRVCINNTDNRKVFPIDWKQGWSSTEMRRYSSSGGIAFSIMKAFVELGGYVASCVFKDGDFVFEITNDLNYIQKFTGSKYVKSNPGNIYEKIQKRLKTDRVLFIGLPCQVAALKNILKVNIDNLYTIDLICHGTPSVKLLDKYLSESNYNLSELSDIKFRRKVGMEKHFNEKMIIPTPVIDCYLCSFLEAVNYTENCYHCQFATIERVSDITLGDSWGTEYTEEEQEGISLILMQTKKGRDLLSKCEAELKNVNLDLAIANNHQLYTPSYLSPKRDKFFRLISRGLSYKMATFIVLPKMMIKQQIKAILLSLKIIKDRCPYCMQLENKE